MSWALCAVTQPRVSSLSRPKAHGDTFALTRHGRIAMHQNDTTYTHRLDLTGWFFSIVFWSADPEESLRGIRR